MKKLGLILLLASTIAFSQNKKNGWDAVKLKGKVKIYRILDYRIDEDGKPFKGNSELLIEFNPVGRTTKIQINNNGVTMSYHDTYNDQGYLVESVSKDEDNKTFSTNLYEYDNKGNRVRNDLLTAEGNLSMSTFSKYNDKSLLIEKSKCVRGKCDERTTFTYDKKGFLIQEDKYKKNVLTSKTLYKNDATGNPLEKFLYDSSDKLLKKVTSKYDIQGNEIETITYEGDGTFSEKKTYLYEYDKMKNWTKKTEFHNGELFSIIEQQFEYYK
jgi:putative cell wall-associated protein